MPKFNNWFYLILFFYYYRIKLISNADEGSQSSQVHLPTIQHLVTSNICYTQNDLFKFRLLRLQIPVLLHIQADLHYNGTFKTVHRNKTTKYHLHIHYRVDYLNRISKMLYEFLINSCRFVLSLNDVFSWRACLYRWKKLLIWHNIRSHSRF